MYFRKPEACHCFEKLWCCLLGMAEALCRATMGQAEHSASPGFLGLINSVCRTRFCELHAINNRGRKHGPTTPPNAEPKT